MKKSIYLLSMLFISSCLFSQTIELRTAMEGKYSLRAEYTDQTTSKELPPIVTSIDKAGQYDQIHLLLYYDQTINDELYKTMVDKKDVPYEYERKGMVSKLLAKKQGLYEIYYKPEYSSPSKRFSFFKYTISINGSVIIENETEDNTHYVIEGDDFMFDHYEDLFPNKYGALLQLKPYYIIHSPEYQAKSYKALKLGANEIKISVTYNNKPIGETSFNYIINEFKLDADNFCKAIKYTKEPNKELADLSKKKFFDNYGDEITEKKWKLISYYYPQNGDWVQMKESGTGYLAERYFFCDTYLQDSDGNLRKIRVLLQSDYLGNGNFGAPYSKNILESISKADYVKNECFELVKTKYGVNK